MTQKKYVVTEDQIQNLVDCLHYRYGRPMLTAFDREGLIELSTVRKKPYVEPAEDWRKNWKLKDDSQYELLYVSPAFKGRLEIVYSINGMPLGRSEDVNSLALLERIQPEVVKVEQWAVLRRDDHVLQVHDSEQAARHGVSTDDRACRFIKLEGSYTK